ncbi:MAG: hypothetical protein QXD48_01390 [Candidatus Aenigmatarchaeota archaeon]
MNLKNDIGPKEKIAIIGSAISFILFSIVLYFSNISVESIVNIQNNILKTLIIQDTGITSSILYLLNSFFLILLSIILLVLGFAFLSSYGYYNNVNKIGMISSIISAIFILILLKFSIMSFFISVGIIISSIYIIQLSNTYGKELKRWIFFRVGSNSISKTFLILNILIALGIFITVHANISVYEQNFRNDIIKTMTDVAIKTVPESQRALLTNEMKENIKIQVENSINNSEIFRTYIKWLPITTALSIWIILEFLRGIILSNIGGLFTTILIRLNRKIK